MSLENEVVIPKKRGKKRKGYFYEREEEAFKTFLQSTDQMERDMVFSTILYPAFTKMIESIIRRYKLYVPDEDFEVTFNATLSFLLTKIEKFDFSKGYKVYSYCGTICKHYVLFRRLQTSKEINRFISYDIVYQNEEDDDRIDDFDMEALMFHDDLIKQIIKHFREVIKEPLYYRLDEKDIKVAESILFILENWEVLFEDLGSKKFNKMIVGFFIKENTKLSSSEIRASRKKINALYFKKKNDILR